MKPNMVVDWSQFGLIISYQCPSCYTTMLLSEQTNRPIKHHSPGVRFDYTGHQIRELGMNGVEQSRYVNIIRKLIKQLDDNNINIDDDEIVPFRWKNEKPIPIGFEVPESDKLLMVIKHAIEVIESGEMSQTLAKELKDVLKGD